MGGVIQSKSRAIYLFILFLLICFAMVLLFARGAHATEGSTVWSWSGKDTEVLFTGNVTTLSNFQYCPTYYLPKNIDTQKGSVQMCMLGDGNIKVGNYFLNTSTFRGFKYSVGFPGDTTMYDLRGMECYSYDGCLYIPEKDMFVSKEYLINGYVRSLVIYKNFSKRLTMHYDPENNYRYFSFDPSVKDYIFQSADGYAWPINSVGASDNGNWLGVEFRERGFGLLNLETFEWKRVSSSWMSYGRGMDSLPQVAVSNDGAHMAIMGINSGLEFIDITPDCGQSVSDLIPFNKTYSRTCKKVYLPIDKVIDGNRFSSGYAPRFNEDGSQLRLYLESYIPERKEVIFGSPDKTVSELDYLALGDSYTSGEGETSDSFYQPYTNDKYEKCHLSTRSYPYLLADLFSINPDKVKSVACSGATTKDIIGEDDSYSGQGDIFDKKHLNLSDSIKTYYQTYARENFIPGRTHQENFLSTNLPKVIMVGVGGNDVGFMKKLSSCVSPGTCEWAATPEGREKSGVEIKSLFPKLVDTYAKLHNDSPGSYIYAVGYPRAVSTSGECGVINNLLLSKDERVFMDEGIKYLNQVIQSAARKAGIGYIDISDAYGEQVLCGSKQPTVMNAIRTGGDIGILGLKFIGFESFHPTPQGHVLTATKIANKYPNIFNSSYCSDSFSTICPEAVDAPELTDYWVEGGIEHSYPQQRKVDYIDNQHLTNADSTVDISVPDYTFEPNSLVKIEVHSTLQLLGSFTTSETGGLQTQVSIPKGLEEGYHSLHVLGKSFAGDEVDVYDFLQIGQLQPKESEENSLAASSSSAPTEQPIAFVENVKNDDKIIVKDESSAKVLGETQQNEQTLTTTEGSDSQAKTHESRIYDWLWLVLPVAGVGLWIALRLRHKAV